MTPLLAAPIAATPPSAAGTAAWVTYVAVVIPVASVVAALWRYVSMRNRELAWRKEELAWRRVVFLFEQARFLDTDPEITAVVNLLAGPDASRRIAVVLKTDKAIDDAEHRKLRHGLDKLLNLLDRIAYAEQENVLSLKDCTNFGWYLRIVGQIPALRSHSEQNGFHDVVALACRVVAEADRQPQKVDARLMSCSRLQREIRLALSRMNLFQSRPRHRRLK